jgi:WD40 repeat protein
VISLAFSQDGHTLATGSADNTARLWELSGGGYTRQLLVGFAEAVDTLAFSPDGRTLATGTWDGQIRLWNVATPSIEASIDKICRSVNRDLTALERSLYLPASVTATNGCARAAGA